MSIAVMSKEVNETIHAEFIKSGWSVEFADFISENWHTSINGARAILDFISRPIPTPRKKKARMTNGLRVQVFERDGYRCQTCNTWESLTVDHIIPESKGGTLAMDNLQTLCKSCNSKKGAKT